MDAISFVMGEKTSSLRVKRLSDLIHGASIGQPVSRTASVTAIITLENEVQKKFTRIVHGSSSEYRIDGDVSQFSYLISTKFWPKCPHFHMSFLLKIVSQLYYSTLAISTLLPNIVQVF